MPNTKDYMSRPEEVAKQPDALATIQEIAQAAPPAEQAAVFNALWSFWNFAHAFDDLIDESGWPLERKELAWKSLLDFSSDLLLNPMFRNHAPEWRALFASAVCRQIDGDAMAQSSDLARAVLAPAVRCADIDVIVHFAYLVGGWPLMRKIGARRDYDKPDPDLNAKTQGRKDAGPDGKVG
jgi:hypothetical protein